MPGIQKSLLMYHYKSLNFPQFMPPETLKPRQTHRL